MLLGEKTVGVLAYCTEPAAGDGETAPTLCVFQSPSGPVGFDTTREIEELFIKFLSRAKYFDGQGLVPTPLEPRVLMVIRTAYFSGTAISFFYFPMGTNQDEKQVTDAAIDLSRKVDIVDADERLNLVLRYSKTIAAAGFQLVWPIAYGEAVRVYPGGNNNGTLQVLFHLASKDGIEVKHVDSVSAMPCW